jgi:hypothetical protein
VYLNDVLQGQDGFLFLGDGAHKETALLCGESRIGHDSVANFSGNLLGRLAECTRREIDYLHVVFPSKHLVYRDKLPLEISSKVKGVYESYYRCGGDLPVLYLKNELIDQRNVDRTFRILDTHMTDFGAQVSARLILRELSIEANLIRDFDRRTTLASGDLAKMLDVPSKVEETILQPSFKYFCSDNIGVIPRNRFHSVIIRNKFSVSGRRLLVFGDSFIQQCLKFLAVYFRDILFVRSSLFQVDLVDMFRPDVVITSNVERYLRDVRSDDRAESFLLSQLNSKDFAATEEHQSAFNAMLSYANYRRVYLDWVAKVDLLFIDRKVELKMQKDIVYTVDGFQSVGRDPIILVAGVSGAVVGKFMVKIWVEVGARSKVYYIPFGGERFSEASSISMDVVKGWNDLSFDIGGIRLGGLRFDPLDCVGRFLLGDMKLS